MDNKIEVNKIKEIYPGHYFVLLDFPAKEDLYEIVDLSYKYIWGFNHIENGTEWKKYPYNLFGKSISEMKIEARNMQFEYIISTNDFVKLVPNINQTISIIQTNIVPPYYMDINRLKGKGKYDLLKNKIDYLFELEMPGAVDYAPLISPSIYFLENVINKLKDK